MPHTADCDPPREDDLAAYRPLSWPAVLALALGVLSAAAPASGVALLMMLPLFGVLVGAWALRSLDAAATPMLGRGAARLGLALSIMLGVAAPTKMLTSRWRLEKEATPVAQLWFDSLRHGEPQKAHQLMLPGHQPLDADLWNLYRARPKLKEELESFVRDPVPRTLLALDGACEARLYETKGTRRSGKYDLVEQTYAVTFTRNDKKTTFFVDITLERDASESNPVQRWRVLEPKGGVRPESLQP